MTKNLLQLKQVVNLLKKFLKINNNNNNNNMKKKKLLHSLLQQEVVYRSFTIKNKKKIFKLNNKNSSYSNNYNNNNNNNNNNKNSTLSLWIKKISINYTDYQNCIKIKKLISMILLMYQKTLSNTVLFCLVILLKKIMKFSINPMKI